MFSFQIFKKRIDKKRVLFHRDYLRFQGGHLKVWHYFNHLKNSELYEPEIYFTEHSLKDETNPWALSSSLKTWSPKASDIIFLAGLDWQAALTNKFFLQNQKKIPVINLIQGLSHADPADIKYGFLSERAIRICVSQQVADAISATKRVNGPIFTIPNGIDLSALPKTLDQINKDIDVLIVALKKPELGLELAHTLNIENTGLLRVKTLTQLMPRAEFLALLNRSRVCLCLPHLAEGFYLPALEAMALEVIVVCPDCIGNRSFCVDQVNCFFPTYDQVSLLAAVQKALSLSSIEQSSLHKNARFTVEKHSLLTEASQFLDIMSDIKNLW